MIKLVNVSKYYHTDLSVNLGLKKVNLELNEGEFVAITGQSGSGKSTLLNVISGLDSYEDGEMYIDGEPTSHYDEADWKEYRKNKIGFIFQDYNLIEGYTVMENVYSILIIKDIKMKEAKKRAKDILERVGLIDKINQKAAKLSSGQKQRLSIARALAKDTQIIVADEPTGNLDVENSKQIIQLLHEISKDKLVVVVTHNVEQVQGIATKRVKMHDGSIVDEIVEVPNKNTSTQKLDSTQNNIRKRKNSFLLSAMRFLCVNLKAHPKRFFTMLMLMLLVTIASFALIGETYIYKDDSSTRIINNKIFRNINRSRIVVRNDDGGAFSDKQIALLERLEHVELVNKDCFSNDVNYFYEEGIDYINNYMTSEKDNKVDVLSKNIKLLNYNKYVKAIGNLENEAFRLGKAPKALDEIAIYSDNDEDLNSVKRVYFSNSYSWQKDLIYFIDMKVVGLLNKPDKQLYFSDRLMHVLSVNNEPKYIKRVYLSNNQLPVSYTQLLPYNFEALGISKNSDAVVVSPTVYDRFVKSEKKIITFIKMKDANNECEYVFDNVSEITHEQSDKILLVSDEKFDNFYNDLNVYECSVFVDDIMYIDPVMSQLELLGFDAISPYKIGVGLYDVNKVRSRLIMLGICCFSIIIIYLLEIVITKSLIKLNKNDFIILKSMGMSNSLICCINYIEMLICYALTIIGTMIIINICCYLQINEVIVMLKYFEINGSLSFIAFNLIATIINAFLYNRYICNKAKITSLKEV